MVDASAKGTDPGDTAHALGASLPAAGPHRPDRSGILARPARGSGHHPEAGMDVAPETSEMVVAAKLTTLPDMPPEIRDEVVNYLVTENPNETWSDLNALRRADKAHSAFVPTDFVLSATSRSLVDFGRRFHEEVATPGWFERSQMEYVRLFSAPYADHHFFRDHLADVRRHAMTVGTTIGLQDHDKQLAFISDIFSIGDNDVRAAAISGFAPFARYLTPANRSYFLDRTIDTFEQQRQGNYYDSLSPYIGRAIVVNEEFIDDHQRFRIGIIISDAPNIAKYVHGKDIAPNEYYPNGFSAQQWKAQIRQESLRRTLGWTKFGPDSRDWTAVGENLAARLEAAKHMADKYDKALELQKIGIRTEAMVNGLARQITARAQGQLSAGQLSGGQRSGGERSGDERSRPAPVLDHRDRSIRSLE